MFSTAAQEVVAAQAPPVDRAFHAQLCVFQTAIATIR